MRPDDGRVAGQSAQLLLFDISHSFLEDATILWIGEEHCDVEFRNPAREEGAETKTFPWWLYSYGKTVRLGLPHSSVEPNWCVSRRGRTPLRNRPW
jgi:hypothetical protein